MTEEKKKCVSFLILSLSLLLLYEYFTMGASFQTQAPGIIAPHLTLYGLRGADDADDAR